MANITRLNDLYERHENMAVAQSKKDLEQINYQVNPNDVPWMFWEPRMKKSLGRSAKVFWQLCN